MRFVDRLPLWLLFLVGGVLAGANLWVTAARSTITLRLSAKIVDREIRHEKHPGQDDVFFLVLEDGRKLHVDEPVFQALQEGNKIEKQRFDHALEIHRADGTHDSLALQPSADLRGMYVVMPVVMGMAFALAMVARRPEKELDEAAESVIR